LIEIINKQLLLQLVGYLCYWQMGFNSVFKGLRKLCDQLPTCTLLTFYFLLLALPNLQQQLSAWQADDLP